MITLECQYDIYPYCYEKSIAATSSLISFNINSPYIPPTYITMPTSTATSSEWVITCDNVSGFFTQSLCYLGQYLFIPKTSDLIRYTDLWNEISIKPPFGYFSLIKNSLSNISTSTTSTFELSGVASLSNFFNPIKTGVSMLLWFLFGFWIFHRFRHIQL